MEPSTPSIAGRQLSPENPPYLVAELSGNHNGSLERARQLVRAAAEAGADAVKLQTYTPDSLTLPIRSGPFEIKGGPWDGNHLHDLYAKAMTPREWHRPLAEEARHLGIPLFSSPFDIDAVDFLEAELDPPAYKIASFEINHLPLLERVAQTGKPVIASTGMASEEEIALAVDTLRRAGAASVLLLKCVSAYPADPRDFNLRVMTALGERFGVAVGLSDHSLDATVALGATALGACFIEKHLTLSRAEGGVDSGFSLEPEEFAQMAREVRKLHQGLGNARIGASAQESQEAQYRRSIFVREPIRAGETFTADNLAIVRPAAGLSPARWYAVLGQIATRDLEPGHPLSEADLAATAAAYNGLWPQRTQRSG